MTAISGCADYVDRTALQGLGAILPEDGPPRNSDSLPGTETRTVRGPNPRSFSTRGGARLGRGVGRAFAVVILTVRGAPSPAVTARRRGRGPRCGGGTLRWRYMLAFAARSSLRGFGSLLTAEDVRDAFVAPATRGRVAEGLGGRPHVVGDPRAQCRVPGRGL